MCSDCKARNACYLNAGLQGLRCLCDCHIVTSKASAVDQTFTAGLKYVPAGTRYKEQISLASTGDSGYWLAFCGKATFMVKDLAAAHYWLAEQMKMMGLVDAKGR